MPVAKEVPVRFTRLSLLASVLAYSCLGALDAAYAVDLHIFYKGKAIPVQVRPATAKELELQLQGDESDEPAKNMARYWKKNPKATYRWDPNSAAEMGLISDIYKETSTAFMMGEEVAPEFMPKWAVAKIDGNDRFLGIATTGGDVKFHADSELRRTGYSGIGTVLVAAYLEACLARKQTAMFHSVNNSYGFYEKLGFQFSDPAHTPKQSKNPALDRFEMHLELKDIPAALKKIQDADAAKANKKKAQASYSADTENEPAYEGSALDAR